MFLPQDCLTWGGGEGGGGGYMVHYCNIKERVMVYKELVGRRGESGRETGRQTGCWLLVA